MKYRKLPVVIDAEQFSDRPFTAIPPLSDEFDKQVCRDKTCQPMPHIHTLEGAHVVQDGAFIIKGVKGEFYSCDANIFALTYEPA